MPYVNTVEHIVQLGKQPPVRRTLVWFTVFASIVVSLLVIDWVLRADTLPVQEISFEGEFEKVTRAELEAAVIGRVNGNYLMMNLQDIKKSLEAIPWVYEASVRRKWPSGIYVSFIEQDIVARWGKAAWLNRFGDEVYLGRKSSSLELLPYLAGPKGTNVTVLETYNYFNALAEEAGMKLTALVYGKRRNWEMRMDNGITVVLGRQQPVNYLERFIRVYPHVLANRASIISRVDLRYTNGFAVAWAPAADKVSVRMKSNNNRIRPDKG